MKHLHRRDFLKNSALLTAATALPAQWTSGADESSAAASVKSSAAPSLPEASWKKLPRWRGFNLLEKFYGTSHPFLEDDFRMIRDLGFNFVRLPMDYRIWIQDGNPRKFDEQVLREIDDAVEYGQKYGIHTMLNFHRAPGYTVAQPAEPKSVWDDEETLDICALHWRTFAKRYAGIPAKNVSFNLFNEPGHVEIPAFMKVHRTLCDVIRAEDPQRLIICDGMSWGTVPTMELAELQVAQSTRGYMPMEISHYHATWAGDYLRDMKEPPTWPIVVGNGLLFCPNKGGITEAQKGPCFISLDPQCGEGRLRLKIRQVSSSARLVAEALDASGKPTAVLFDHEYKPADGSGDWEEVIYKPEWNCFQNVYHKDEFITVPVGTKRIRLQVVKGDWLSLEQIAFSCKSAPDELSFACSDGWNAPPFSAEYKLESRPHFEGMQTKDRNWHRENYIKPWKEWEKLAGVMVGEFGAFNQTPHEVVLAWMNDLLANWHEAGWGWAMWNFRGSIGVMNSNRSDAEYVDYYGLKMDKKMMELLQKY